MVMKKDGTKRERLKSAWTKNNLREVKNTMGRFIAILAIVALGVGFFSGLSVAKDAMIKTANEYINNEAAMYDFRFLTTIGFTEEDIKYYSSLDGVKAVEGLYSIDFFGDMEIDSPLSSNSSGEKARILKAYSITKRINNVKLISGRMPTSEQECLVDASIFGQSAINTTIKISEKNSDSTKDFFKYDEYIIVGTCRTVNYLNRQRGSSTLEGGSLDGFVFFRDGAFQSERMTELIIDANAHGVIFSEEYDSGIEALLPSMEEALAKHALEEYEAYMSEFRVELDSAKDEYESEYSNYLTEKNKAESELDSALYELEKVKSELDNIESELENAKSLLLEGEEAYLDGMRQYDEGMRAYEAQREAVFSALDDAQDEVDINRRAIEAALGIIEGFGAVERYREMVERRDELIEIMASIEDHESPEYIEAYIEYTYLSEQIQAIEASGAVEQYQQLLAASEELDNAQAELDAQRERAESEFEKAEKQLISSKVKLDDLRKQLDDSKLEYTEGLIKFYDAKAKYEDGLKEYEAARKEADEGFLAAEEKFSQALAEIEKAESQYDEFASAELMTFVLDRSSNTGYVCFENDASIVDGIAKVLPIFFFLVAALVCTTTMTRMVDEHRTQIGTLKALGYSDGNIVMKYVSYSGSAALMGCFIGFFGGSIIFPYAIWQAYKLLYDFGDIMITFDAGYGLISLVVSLICTAGATYVVCRNELTKMPSELMRPKAPTAGKRVILEKIPFIWNHMSFLNKVAARNILRYKRRLIMMLLGVGGCTALVLAGFGLRDSIANIVDYQFEDIMHYDYAISFANSLSEDEIEEFLDETKDKLSKCVFVTTDSFDIETSQGVKNANIVATNDMNITDIISFISEDGNLPEDVKYPGSGGVFVSEKLAELADASLGDSITVKLSETEKYELKIEGIFKNYVFNYIYMTADTYSEIPNHAYSNRTAYAVANGEDIYGISASLIKENGAATVAIVNDIKLMVDNMMSSMNYIVALVILSACALAFVVAYNLGNITITERTREIATLKVLGFQPSETSSYVSRENIVITIIGSIAGLPFGVLLLNFVMSQINIDMVSFDTNILFQSYLYAFFISVLMSILVAVALLKKIDAVNPAESLKSVD